MRIIAQKSNTLSTYDFFYNALTRDYIDAINLSITYTKDNKIVIFNSQSANAAITNTINTNTFEELQQYEIILLDVALENLNINPIKKDLYINLTPSNPIVLDDTNIQEVTRQMNNYVDEVKRIIDKYKNLTINLHSNSRNLVSIMKQRITNYNIGFSITGNDFNFIDVDYYVLISNTQNDAIIDTLLNQNKIVIIYVYSDYYISFLYEHYLGEKSTPYLQEVFTKLSIMTNYPEIIHKVFET